MMTSFVRVNLPVMRHGDFVQYEKKTPRRYHLGGFLPSITEDKIARYVNRRGPTVTFVRIWHSKRNKRNVVIG